MRLREYVPGPLRALGRRISDKFSPRYRSIGSAHDPYDRAACESIAEKLFKSHEEEQPLGTVGRGRLILQLIEASWPTQHLAAEYFRNLERLLEARDRRTDPGQLLLGVGTGRSGSTSLTALLATVEDSCCTHENPPLVFWEAEHEQLQFHMKRFKLLTEYYSLVTDVSHYWLNAIDGVCELFPESKVVGLCRDVDECAQSFMRLKGSGRGSSNHWAPYGNGIWSSHGWDPTYPTYSVPGFAKRDPDRAKYEMIARYIREYNAKLENVATRRPGQVMLVRTDNLNESGIQAKIFAFVGLNGRASKLNLNVRSVTDGESEKFRF